jgi:hypothetical protein
MSTPTAAAIVTSTPIAHASSHRRASAGRLIEKMGTVNALGSTLYQLYTQRWQRLMLFLILTRCFSQDSPPRVAAGACRASCAAGSGTRRNMRLMETYGYLGHGTCVLCQNRAHRRGCKCMHLCVESIVLHFCFHFSFCSCIYSAFESFAAPTRSYAAVCTAVWITYPCVVTSSSCVLN